MYSEDRVSSNQRLFFGSMKNNNYSLNIIRTNCCFYTNIIIYSSKAVINIRSFNNGSHIKYKYIKPLDDIVPLEVCEISDYIQIVYKITPRNICLCYELCNDIETMYN